jgi:ribonuclease HI
MPIIWLVDTLQFFGDSKLVVNLVREIYSPINKLMKRYTQIVWLFISNLLSFNITHVKRELNSIADRLVVCCHRRRPRVHLQERTNKP